MYTIATGGKRYVTRKEKTRNVCGLLGGMNENCNMENRSERTISCVRIIPNYPKSRPGLFLVRFKDQ
jgi:hypothetical protein